MGRKERYKRLRLLGEGGQAQVFEVRDSSHAKFALKQPIDPTDQDARARAAREIEVQSSLNHPNVMPLVDFASEEGWLVMPLATQFLMQSDESDDSGLGRAINDLDDAELLEVVKQVVEGVAAAHDHGFTHRDIKPSNVLFLCESSPRWVLADWGVVRRPHGKTTVLRTHHAIGTDRFAAPEQWSRGHDADHRSDYYSVGRLVAAARSSAPLIQNVPSVPDGPWRRFVREMTAIDPGERPQDAAAVRQLIEQVEAALQESDASSDSVGDAVSRLMQYPDDRDAAQVVLVDAPSSLEANNVLLDDVPDLPRQALTTICRVGSDEEVRAFAKAIAEQSWGHRDFNHANDVLLVVLQIARICTAEERWGVLEDVAEVYVEMCRAWDRWKHRGVSRGWLERLPNEAQSVMVRVLKGNPKAVEWYADDGWRPTVQAPRLRHVFDEVLNKSKEGGD